MALIFPDVSLVDYLNPACAADNTFNATATALDPVIQDVLAAIPNNITVSDIYNLQPEILDFIAQFHFNVDGYDPMLPLISRQNLVVNVIQNKIVKGTAFAIEQTIALTLNYAELVEWWQTTPPGVPYTFYILLTGNPTAAQTATATANVLKLKNVRSWFTGFQGFDYNLAPATLYSTAGYVQYDYYVLGNQELQLVTTYPTT